MNDEHQVSAELYYSIPFLKRQFMFHPLRFVFACGMLMWGGYHLVGMAERGILEPAKAWENIDKVAAEAMHARYGAEVMLADGTKVKVLEQYHLPALVGVSQWDVANGVDLIAMATPANRIEHCEGSPLFVGKEIALPTENPRHLEGPADLYHVGRAYFVKSVTAKPDNWATIYQYDDRTACLTKLTIDKTGAGYAKWPRDQLISAFSDVDYALANNTKVTYSSYKHSRWNGSGLHYSGDALYAKDVAP